MTPPLFVAYGGGLNSTAMLVGMRARDVIPDVILFADTGGEKPETYAHVEWMSDWCRNHKFPRIATVKHAAETLEEKCLRNKTMPSLAYGFKSCSIVFKHRPQNAWAKQWWPAIEWWASGGKCRKALGYDAGESRRAKIVEDEEWHYWHPLIEWGWDRERCLAEVKAAGVPMPCKSSCFFCPASSKREVLALAKTHPDLMARALAMEARAQDGSFIKGLGRRYAWAELIQADSRQQRLFPEADELPCMCADGEED